MKAFNFLTKRAFYIHLVIIIALVIILIHLTFSSLDRFTRHGKEILVPDFVGMNCDEVLEKYKDDYNFILLDSIYARNFLEGSIYQQDPLPNSKVKKGRNLYYIKVSVAPERVAMPNLRNLSLRQAMVMLNANGLKVAELEFVEHFAKNAVVEQLLNDSVIEPGQEVVKGSALTLQVGYGVADKRTHLPNLLTVNKSEVKAMIHEASLNLGEEIFMDADDMENYKVYKMEPAYDIQTLVTLGSKVNVYYKSKKLFDFDAYGRELVKKDSVIDVMKKKKINEDAIKHVSDSFDYIITHKLFLFDSISREYDKNIVFHRGLYEYIYRNDTLDMDSLFRVIDKRNRELYYED